jgi:hypothetical protein
MPRFVAKLLQPFELPLGGIDLRGHDASVTESPFSGIRGHRFGGDHAAEADLR